MNSSCLYLDLQVDRISNCKPYLFTPNSSPIELAELLMSGNINLMAGAFFSVGFLLIYVDVDPTRCLTLNLYQNRVCISKVEYNKMVHDGTI
jgi:hypothetical protein